MKDRFKTHYSINTRLSMMSDMQLKTLLFKAKISTGMTQNGIVEVEGHKVFVKRVPLTNLELANAYSTKNLYRIPAWYNYGVGSAGFGAFRELAAHVKTTNWVREGQIDVFPLLHHHRIISAKETSANISDLKDYVAYWNGSKTIERYMLDRHESKQHLILFLECVTPITDWIVENPSKLSAMFRKSLKSIDFLHKNGIIHFDAHIHNWLTDGRKPLLTDFGLLLDKEFELTKTERKFFSQHRYYDYAQVVQTFGNALIFNHLSLNAQQKQTVEKELDASRNNADPYLNSMIRVLLDLHDKKRIRLPSALVKFVRQYQPISKLVNIFFQDILTGKKASDKYPARKLMKLLRQSEVID